MTKAVILFSSEVISKMGMESCWRNEVSDEGEEGVASVDFAMRWREEEENDESNDADSVEDAHVDVEIEIIMVRRNFKKTTSHKSERRIDTGAASLVSNWPRRISFQNRGFKVDQGPDGPLVRVPVAQGIDIKVTYNNANT
jgi:hypothetical protein